MKEEEKNFSTKLFSISIKLIKVKKYSLPLFTFIYLSLLVILLIKTSLGNNLYLQSDISPTTNGQVFESSLSRGRYALVISFVDNKSLNYSQKVADFAAPDASYAPNGKYISIWPPGVPVYLAIFYLLGKQFNLGLLFVSFGSSLLAIVSSILIFIILKNFKIKSAVALLASSIFIVSSNVLAYSGILSAHLLTTTIALLMILLSFSKKPKFIKQILFWALYGFAIWVDLPNSLLLFPVGLYFAFKTIIIVVSDEKRISFRLETKLLLGLISFIAIFFSIFIYNHYSSGKYAGFGQTSNRYSLEDKINLNGVAAERSSNRLLPFDLAVIPENITEFVVGKQRGLLFYFPVFLISIFGLSIMIKRNKSFSIPLIALLISNFLIYAMFDPFGGWAFGPRYLIPSFAVLSVTLGITLDVFRRKILFNMIFIPSLAYSMIIAVLGAVTTLMIPPKDEASGLGLDWTVNICWKFLKENNLGSYVYQKYLSTFLSNNTFYILVYFFAVSLVTFLYLYSFRKEKNE